MTDPNHDDTANASQENPSIEEQNSPTNPSPNDEVDSTADLKASKKREREVSLEPATPRTDDTQLVEAPERPIPANKKNRVKLDITAEEDETPPSSPKQSAELSTSPPYESKVRQISMRVRGMKWEDRPSFEASPETASASGSGVVVEGQEQLAPAASISSGVETSPNAPQETTKQDEVQQEIGTENDTSADTDVLAVQEGGPPESDSEDQDKALKRKLGDQAQVSVPDRPTTTASVEPAKRARDDAEEDDNPREKKRPSPPPEEDKAEVDAPPPAAQPKLGGFLAYATPASPFAAAKGPSIFSNKSAPSPFASASSTTAKSPVASSSSSSISSNLPPSGNTSPTTSAFSNQQTTSGAQTQSKGFAAFASSSTSTPTGTKRTGFEAFASSSSPFAAASRSKSPTGFSRGNNQSAIGASLARSKSPPRRGGSLGSSGAFKSYAALSSPFAAATPPVKKQRQESGSGSSSDNGEGTEGNKSAGIPSALAEGASPEGSEEESEKQTFGERLRAGKDNDENAPAGSDEEDNKLLVTKQEAQTGEEHEETVFQVRGKLYALSDQNAWKERGTGLLKINVRKVDGNGARLLMRKDAVHTLLLNVPLFKGMRCSTAQDPRYVRFSCIENGKTAHYNVRLANAKLATELLEEINANIPSEDPSGNV